MDAVFFLSTFLNKYLKLTKLKSYKLQLSLPAIYTCSDIPMLLHLLQIVFLENVMDYLHKSFLFHGQTGLSFGKCDVNLAS